MCTYGKHLLFLVFGLVISKVCIGMESRYETNYFHSITTDSVRCCKVSPASVSHSEDIPTI